VILIDQFKGKVGGGLIATLARNLHGIILFRPESHVFCHVCVIRCKGQGHPYYIITVKYPPYA